jgi:uncharacterized protein (DUF302 family)
MPGTLVANTLRVRVKLPYERAVKRVVAALKEEGFGVLTEIDVRATLKQKLGVEFFRYTILGACNPPLAYRALCADLQVGLLLPCNLIVYERDEGTEVSLLDPVLMLKLVQNPDLELVAWEARSPLERVVDRLERLRQSECGG